MKKLNVLVALLFITGMASAQTTWNLDKAHTNIQFNVTHMVVSEVNGSFTDFEGQIISKSEDFNGAEVTFTAKTGSVNTGNENRDKHLKSDDFFNAEQFPDIKFNGTIVKTGGKYQLKGNFTIRDVTKPVVFDITYGGQIDTGRGVKAGFKFTGKINRLDYGLKWSNKLATGELAVADEVEVVVKVELNKVK
ncbi:MAG: YceI family protein [Cyclobacteriaceae bacterium]|nr:YceI family protein [Cyclobacteriaceae bacterium]